MKMVSNAVYFLFFSLFFVSVFGQPNANTKGVRRQKMLRKKADAENNKLFNALTVQYPLHFFSPDASDWRTPAKYNENFVHSAPMRTKGWLESSLAQDQEDVWLFENWFFGMTNGVIMESGALDGVLFSTSWMYEDFLNWTSIHVEADPENYKNLQGNREKAINIHGALCNEPKLLHYSSAGVIPVRGFVEFMSESFLKKWHGKVYNKITPIESLPTVQCLPVKHLLRELNIKHIDIWILDTEGSEESVLSGVDFDKIHYNAVAMECDYHDTDKNNRKMSILESHGFERNTIERNCMCKHKDFKPSANPNPKTELKKFNGRDRSVGYSNTNKDTSN